MSNYRSRSMWLDGVPGELSPRPSSPGDIDVDVAIVGAGLTGLWTAYYLKKADPLLRIAVIEKEIAGFGASGRNGGWCSSFFAAPRERTEKWFGRQAAVDMQREMFHTVDEVGRVVAAEGIDARYHKGGVLRLATSPMQLTRLKNEFAYHRSWGFGEEHYRMLAAAEAHERLHVRGTLAGLEYMCSACVDPARFTRGLADVVEKLGVPVYEQTQVTAIQPHALTTTRGIVKAEVVVCALEAYLTTIPGFERRLFAFYSHIIGTEPLSKKQWDEIGWSRRETFADARHLGFYAQHTKDDRIAIGGLDFPYHYGSKISDNLTHNPRVFKALEQLLHDLFPQIGDLRVTHSWGGPCAGPRDGYPSVGLDEATGVAWAGGYMGDAVSTTNLSGRTLTDLILRRDSEIRRLPWVNHRSKPWEQEPLRWFGVKAVTWSLKSADRREARTGRPAEWRTGMVKKVTGMSIG